MAPQLQEFSVPDLIQPVNPIVNFQADNDSVSLSDIEIWSSDLESEEENVLLGWNVPVQNDLKDLLIKVTATEDLQTVTQVKLKVITREISLQQLSIYTPALRELILDGSYVSSLRDLGCELKNLKVLRLNRCNLHHLDSVSAIEHLEELYAADNHLTDISSCGFLSHIKIIDVRRNNITATRCFFFLSLCTELQHLYLDGNGVTGVENYAGKIKGMIPALRFLDGRHLEGPESNAGQEGSSGHGGFSGARQIGTPSRIGRRRESRSFLIQFPPKLLVDSHGKTNRSM